MNRSQVAGRRTKTNFHAIVHAQPLHMTYLSHVPAYRDAGYLSRRLLSWQPEAIINLPEGLGVAPFCVPGSQALMAATVESLRTHRLIVWSKHGVMARSDHSVKHACDYVDYMETAARYECLNLSNHEIADALQPAEIREIAETFGIKQSIF